VKTKADLIVGIQWGDEGKGKIVDLLAQNYDYVVRYQEKSEKAFHYNKV